MNRRFSPLSPEERHRRKKALGRAYYRRHGKHHQPREVSPKLLAALGLIDRGETDSKLIATLSGISRTYTDFIKRTLRMRGSRRTSWCEHRLTKLLAKIEEVRKPIPDWLRPYSQELHKLYSQCEDVMAMMRRP